MHYIGVTGGVGCGKSEVLRFLEEEYDCEVLRSDELARELMLPGGCCFEPVLALFGEEVLGTDGQFDRQAIAKKVFGNPELLDALNQITHPAVREEIARRVEAARKSGRKFFFLEAALLIEEKYDEICNELWYVYAEESVRRKRLAQSRGYSEEKISAVMANQLSEDVFRKHCRFVVDNSGSMENTREQIRSYMRSAFH
jgi:dephospho-CoA kinase|uniref:Dephospho-CoA kinase n=1 Tax=Eubacterium cellulosolvens (strain ATCC 43171 / JCM 9499 / 6) TaxID=633697 RepID=I5AQC9_EUBC6